jgi:hypothetical protein
MVVMMVMLMDVELGRRTVQRVSTCLGIRIRCCSDQLECTYFFAK